MVATGCQWWLVSLRGCASHPKQRCPRDHSRCACPPSCASCPQPWFAGVAHDLALCARAYNAGDRQLRGVQHARSSGRGDGERLNFPLSCYVNQPLFWTVLENMSFGELAIKLRSSRELDKVGSAGRRCWVAWPAAGG